MDQMIRGDRHDDLGEGLCRILTWRGANVVCDVPIEEEEIAN